MQPSSYYFPPLAPLFFLGLILLFGAAVALIQIGVLQYAYEKMGIRREYVFTVLVLSLLGSYVNIPVAELPPEPVQSDLVVTHFGVHYLVPEVEAWRRTVLAVNVGGAIIPTVLSIYLMVKNRLYRKGLLLARFRAKRQ